MRNEKRVIGRIDKIDFPEFGLENIDAKIDTGANRSSLHCTDIRVNLVEGKEELSFHIPLLENGNPVVYHTTDFFTKNIRSSSGHLEERYIIKTPIVIFGKKILATFSLSNREEMKYPILLGRKLLRSRYIVDVGLKNLSFNEKMKSQ